MDGAHNDHILAGNQIFLAERFYTCRRIGYNSNSIAASVAITSYQSALRSQKLSAAAINTAQWLDSIRKRSIQQNSRCEIRVDASNKVLSEGTSNTCGSFGTFSVADSSTDGRDISFCYRLINPLQSNFDCTSSTLSSAQDIIFSPRGTTETDYAFEFFIGNNSSKACTVVLSPVGIIRSGRVEQNICRFPT